MQASRESGGHAAVPCHSGSFHDLKDFEVWRAQLPTEGCMVHCEDRLMHVVC
jgi:hypothetical protein